MHIVPAAPKPAWQPLTPRGVAAFARASLRRLLLVQFVGATAVALAIAWFLHDVWFPHVDEAIGKLPAQSEIRAGKLAWRGESPLQLAGDRYIALVVDLNHEAEIGHEADFCFEFGQKDVRIFSLLGYLTVKYPNALVVTLNRAELQPWWGAWSPVILAGTIAITVVGLMTVWAVLALLYAGPALLVAFFANRSLDGRGAWQLAMAAQLPGAVVMLVVILLYGEGWLDIVGLVLGFAAHLLVCWVYVLVSPLFCPRLQSPEIVRGNPFAPTGKS